VLVALRPDDCYHVADLALQVCWTVREMHARLSTALVLSSRIGVRSLKSDRSFSTTSKPSSKGIKTGWSQRSLLPADRYLAIAEAFLPMYST
jgi:hypothetical protein